MKLTNYLKGLFICFSLDKDEYIGENYILILFCFFHFHLLYFQIMPHLPPMVMCIEHISYANFRAVFFTWISYLILPATLWSVQIYFEHLQVAERIYNIG